MRVKILSRLPLTGLHILMIAILGVSMQNYKYDEDDIISIQIIAYIVECTNVVDIVFTKIFN